MQPKNKFEEIILYYSNAIARGLIALLTGLLLLVILRFVFNLNAVLSFVISFCFSILISPIYNKINFGEIVMIKYFEFLDRQMKKLNKPEKEVEFIREVKK